MSKTMRCYECNTEREFKRSQGLTQYECQTCGFERVLTFG